MVLVFLPVEKTTYFIQSRGTAAYQSNFNATTVAARAFFYLIERDCRRPSAIFTETVLKRPGQKPDFTAQPCQGPADLMAIARINQTFMPTRSSTVGDEA